ncbi:hypothetical protein HS5_03140 [Acidianus sp. HS-5]|nr:hypothetical protein HS5_03140 [Acidianus sp. HS-5]
MLAFYEESIRSSGKSLNLGRDIDELIDIALDVLKDSKINYENNVRLKIQT